MQVDYVRADDPETVVATAHWDGAVRIETQDEKRTTRSFPCV